MESSVLHLLRSDASQSFSGLSADERRHLREWQMVARVAGVEAVEDLTQRQWPCRVEGTVIGVFQAGSELAAWLVIGHNGAWAVACCTQGEVSGTLNSLAEALAAIYPGGAEPARPERLC